ncbi:hypothetical protein ACPFL9_13635 [Paenarthrobacter sp. NyZ202]|uniref:hypothetical protein n=1 Tax=Paenarthrobacter sp. NyZ202 TaxID=3402689 RepID=UPI003CE9C2ED
MRRLFPLAVPLALLLAACTVPTTPPGPGSTGSQATSPASTAGPSRPPSSVPPSRDGTAGEVPQPAEDDPGRFIYACTSLDAAPEVRLSSLAEVWAAPNYTRFESCEVSFEGDGSFDPSNREAQAIDAAAPGGTDDPQAVIEEVLRLCTRISDETGPGGFAEAGRETLLAAAAMCPDAPQAGIINGWADGTRTGDGSVVAGESLQPGSYQVVKQGPAPGECSWTVADPGGGTVGRGGMQEALAGVPVDEGQKFTSDKCGIWWKMY